MPFRHFKWILLAAVLSTAANVFGAGVEGSTYLVKRSFAVSAAGCSTALDEVSRLLFGEKDEQRDLAVYATLSCSGDPTAPLRVEALFEPPAESERGRLETWMRELETRSWNGQELEPRYVQTIFWNLYGTAAKGDGSLAGGFERPRIARSFGDVVGWKNGFRAVVEHRDFAGLSAELASFLGPREWSRWRIEVLPLSILLDFQIHTYFLTADETAEKSQLVYRFQRDCRALSCEPAPVALHED